ncbi:hypothetical protein KKE45_01800 [Patescibacteria group bacterium]|nr:hypothetical protein [Patescibacteria group bacterium]
MPIVAVELNVRRQTDLPRSCFGNASPQTVLPTIHRVSIVPGEQVKADQLLVATPGLPLVEVVTQCLQLGPQRQCARTGLTCVHPTYNDQVRTHVYIPD